MNSRTRQLEWTLRIGACMCFVGHGVFGLMRKEAWVAYFAVAGIGRDTARTLMPMVGTLDIGMGLLMLIRPTPALALWMTLWAIWTALLRPLSGEPIWEAFERAGNYGIPAAYLAATWATRRSWFALTHLREIESVAGRLRGLLSTAMVFLLAGHGTLSAIGKAGLVRNYASVTGADLAARIVRPLGWFEIALAGLIATRANVPLLIFACAWKVLTEALFITAGSSFWEWVERGGSYAVPIALALVLSPTVSRRSHASNHPSSARQNIPASAG